VVKQCLRFYFDTLSHRDAPSYLLRKSPEGRDDSVVDLESFIS